MSEILQNTVERQAGQSESVFTEEHSIYGAAISDFVQGAKLRRIWVTMAWNSLRQTYKRSWIGIAWVALSFALFAGVKIFIFGALSGRSLAFFGPYLAIGFLSFRLISGSITGGASAFVVAQNWIRSEPLPLSLYIYRLMMNNLIVFGFNAIPAFLICLIFNAAHLMVLVCLPAVLLIYAINSLWASTLIGIIGTRYRDLIYFISTVTQVMYFMTPILWVPPETGPHALIARYNPFTHYIEILRAPMLEGTIPWNSWMVVIGCTLIGALVSFLVYARARKSLIFWL